MSPLASILGTPLRVTGIYDRAGTVHPLFFSWCNAEPFPCAFSLCVKSRTGRYYEASGMASVPLLSVRQLAQNLPLLVDAMLESSSSSGFGRGDSHIEAIVTAGVIPEGRAWGERPVWCTPAPQNAMMPKSGGWLLYVNLPNFASASDLHCSIVRTCRDAEGEKVVNKAYTAAGFLEKLEQDGYYTPPEAIATLNATLARLSEGG